MVVDTHLDLAGTVGGTDAAVVPRSEEVGWDTFQEAFLQDNPPVVVAADKVGSSEVGNQKDSRRDRCHHQDVVL